jgi:alkanesulfonate monooxygenase
LAITRRKFDPDGSLPDIPESNDSRSARERVIAMAQHDNLTVRQLAQRLGGYGGLARIGTPATIADEIGEWLTSYACDGSSSCFRICRVGSTTSSTRRSRSCSGGGFSEYESAPPPVNLGLRRPKNRFLFAGVSNSNSRVTSKESLTSL